MMTAKNNAWGGDADDDRPADDARNGLMYSYIVRRLAFGALTVVGVSIIVFVVMRILPGDPLVAIFGPGGLHQAQRGGARRLHGGSSGSAIRWWCSTCLGEGHRCAADFGRSFFRSESVADMILRRGPLTAEIALISVVLSWIVGIPVAIVSALRPNSIGDNVVAFRQHPVPGGAGLLGRHADRAGAAVLVRLSRADGRRLAVRRSAGATCRS